MRLLFKQRLFSWLDCYDIYDEDGSTVFQVQGRLAWGHKLEIFDNRGQYQGMVREEIFTLLPRFAVYKGQEYCGHIKKEFTFFRPRFTLEYHGWSVEGNFMEWDYRVTDSSGTLIMTASKELFRWADTYTIDVEDECDALDAVMIVLAIDAAKCASQSNS